MSGQPCPRCYRWFTEPYWRHMQRHILAEGKRAVAGGSEQRSKEA